MQGFKKLMVAGLAALSASAAMGQKGGPATSGPAVVRAKIDTSIKVSGIITDAATGKPLPAVSVTIPGFYAAFTDDQGRFSIVVPNYKATLLVSGEGLQTREVALKGRRKVSVALYEEGFQSLYDNVVLPFGSRPRTQVTQAVTSIHTDGAWNRPTETPDSYLQGKVAGLSPVMRSGTAGVGALLALRGYHSLNATNQPLIVVDGMIYDNTDYGTSLISGHYTNPLALIDVKDIENITVLKDAVSTYGSKAANGVILITTAHAKELATKIDAAVYGGVNFAPQSLPVMQASDYRVYLSDMLKSRGWSNANIQSQPYMNDDPSNAHYFRYHNETDWQNQVLKTSYNKNAYLKVSGGDNIAKYALSMGYLNSAGVTRGTDLNRYSVRFNGDLNLTKKLTAQTNLSATRYEQNLAFQGQSYKVNPLFLALAKAPFLDPNDISDAGAKSPNLAETDTFGVGNPVAAIRNVRANSKAYRFFGSINLRYQLSPFIAIYSQGGITLDQVREQTFVPRKGIAEDTLSSLIADSRMGGSPRRVRNLFNETYVDYNRTFHRIHRLQARAGVRFQHSSTEGDYAGGLNSSTDDFVSVSYGVAASRTTGGYIGKAAWVNSYIGAHYGLMDKYFVSVNGAVDASTRFGNRIPNALKIGANNFAVLPSVGASWLVSSENFMSAVKALSLLKLRASYGLTGNDDIGNYTAQTTYTSQNLLGMQGLVRSSIGNPYLQWEGGSRANAGLDAALLNERISLSVDVYQNKTDRMLVYQPLAAATGYTALPTNSGKMKTEGIDLSLNGRILHKKALKWDVGVLLSAYRNTITRLPGNEALEASFGGATLRTQTGSPAGLFYGYKTAGVYRSDEAAAADGLSAPQTNGSFASFQGGDIRFVDVNGDKVIDASDRQVIGDPNPDLTGAFTNRLSWKRFTAEAIITFTSGGDLYNGVRAVLEAQSSAANQLESVQNRWRVPGQVTNMPRAAWGDPVGNARFSDRWIEDGSFARLKVLSLSYNLPFKGAKMVKYATLYATANNLVTVTKYLGYDPEFSASESVLGRGVDTGLEPQFRSVTAGIRIGL
ncbi:SusC/RagA family TonB-linked outer membrane protein [Paraflavisolibacter sp. H34]|uniref:SusC/RagA family TonB-linked outer membrane protein n=1 Tax=Huijunlia imazamoxiresistens TaxID=3127457 RepID=UPI003015DA79